MIAEEQIIERLFDHTVTQRRTYYGVTWDAYSRLLDELGDGSRLRLTYAEGVLEVMSPLSEHEELSRLIDAAITFLVFVSNRTMKNCGAMTMRAVAVKRGGEPDSNYYIQSEPLVRGVKNIDLAIHPPPDIVLEIDITSPSLSKLPLYAALGVPELWRHDGTHLVFHKLTPTGYVAIEHSIAFPTLSAETLVKFLHTGQTEGTSAMLRSVQSTFASS